MKLFADGFFYHLEIHQNKKKYPYLFLIHGFMGSGTVFKTLVKKTTDFCNPVTIDLLGHGKTEGSKNPARYRYTRQVSDLKSIFDRLALENLYLYGYSMGGRLTLLIALKHMRLFKGLILESSGCGLDDEISRSEREKLDNKRAKEITDDYDTFIKNWNLNPLFFGKPGKPANTYHPEIRQQVPEYIAACLRGFGNGVMPPVCQKLDQLRIPCLLLAGSADQKYVSQLSGIKNKIPDAELKIIENAGHRIHYDQTELVAENIRSFIS